MRFNVKDSFEACYLKSQATKKAFKNEDKISTLMNSPNFHKIVKNTSQKIYRISGTTLKRLGYELEDVQSIATIYGLQSVNHGIKEGTEGEKLISHFITQRMYTFLLQLSRKFHTNEQVFGDWDPEEIIKNTQDISLNPEFLLTPKDKVPKSPRTNSSITRSLKKDLKENFDRHIPRLIELSCSKFVNQQVRKSARRICKQNNIDYIAETKKMIESKGLDHTLFCLR